MFPKVSVMIPTYNHRDFIQESLESVLIQNYPNLEIIVADDASTDGSQKIIQEYYQKYPYIFKIILAEKNEGITNNCNRAFFACTGKYIAFFSGDDVMLPGKLIKQVTLMETNPNCVISHHNVKFFESSSGKILGTYYGPWSSLCNQGGVEILIQYGCTSPSVMARRDACPTHGYDPKIPISSDWLFFIETAAQGGEIVYIPEVLGRYRRHQNNATNKITDNSELLETLRIVEKKYPHLAKYIKIGQQNLTFRHRIKKLLIVTNLKFLYRFIRQIFYLFRIIGLWLNILLKNNK